MMTGSQVFDIFIAIALVFGVCAIGWAVIELYAYWEAAHDSEGGES